MADKPLKILAIDDEQLLLWALERAFKEKELLINTATTAEQALEKISLNHYDLFLLHFGLKNQNCQKLLKQIDERCPYIPIIIMTTGDMNSAELNEEIRSVRKQGAWHLLEKPFRLDKLVGSVEHIFQEQHLIKLSLPDLSHNFDHEKRNYVRRPHVLPMNLRIKQILDGQTKEIVTQSILTDISECGVGLLSNSPLETEQIVGFGGELKEQYGIVAWCNMIEAGTCRAGIRLC